MNNHQQIFFICKKAKNKNMKLKCTLSILIIFITLTVSGQMPNASFELWTDSMPDLWTANNFPPTLYPITRTTDAHSGTYALKGEVVSYNGGEVPPNVYPSSTSGFGCPVNQRYSFVNGWYKSSLIGNDIGNVNIVIYHSSGLSIGYGFTYLPAASVYTPFSIPITYTANAPAASATVTFSMTDSTGAFNEGSNFIIDDLAFSMTTGISENELAAFTIGPIPATDVLNIDGDFHGENSFNFTLVNIQGKKIMEGSAKVSANRVSIIVSDLENGIYFLNDEKKSVVKRILINR